MPIQTLNPFTNKIEKTFEPFSAKQIDEIIEKAEITYQTWKKSPFSERKKLFRNLANELKTNSHKYDQFPTLEMGKLINETKKWELDICAKIANYYANNGKRFMKPITLKRNPFTGSTVIKKYPLGVLFGIMPWNFPYYQVMRFAIPNIMAGNTVIIKHASNVPQCALAIEAMFKAAGFPDGVYNTVFISGENSKQCIEDYRVKGISLTGSEMAGAKVAALAGKYLKKVVLELGGNDPFIVLDDADINYASDLAVLGRFFNSGQTCIASKRFIIHQNRYDDFLKHFIKKTKQLQPGNPIKTTTNFAPMSSQKEVDNLLELINDAVTKGAKIELGGKRIKNLEGAWLEPTIISGVTKTMMLYNKELFGPVAVVHKVKTDDEAITLANDSNYGLSSVIIGKNKSKIKAISEQLQTGMTFINTISISEPDSPFGGTKNSGFGRELGQLGMEEFINKKTVRKIPVWAFKLALKQLQK